MEVVKSSLFFLRTEPTMYMQYAKLISGIIIVFFNTLYDTSHRRQSTRRGVKCKLFIVYYHEAN